MSSLSVSASQFEIIETNLNVELITPILEDLGLFSPSDTEKLSNKSQKPAVKLILKKVKQHPEGSKLFQSALEQTKINNGHQKILEVLYHMEDLSFKRGTIQRC